jgi:hypothetical protein
VWILEEIGHRQQKNDPPLRTARHMGHGRKGQNEDDAAKENPERTNVVLSSMLTPAKHDNVHITPIQGSTHKVINDQKYHTTLYL